MKLGEMHLSDMTSPTNGRLSAAEIAKLRLPGLPTTKANVLARAQREGWEYEEVTGLGGLRKLFEVPEIYFSKGRLNSAIDLLLESGYSTKQITTEVRIKNSRRSFRLDVAVHETGQEPSSRNIIAVIECKNATPSWKEWESHVQRLLPELPKLLWAAWTNGKDRLILSRRLTSEGNVEWVRSQTPPAARRLLPTTTPVKQLEGEMPDPQLLEAIIEGIERFTAQTHAGLSPQRKATLISLFYRYFREEGGVDQAKLAEMLDKIT